MKTVKLLMLFAFMGLFMVSCVEDEIFEGPPVVSELTINPAAPSENQAVAVSVKVTDLNGVKTVTLYYKAGAGDFISAVMTAGANNTYTAQIPGQASDVTVNYYVAAENVSGDIALYPNGAPTNTAAYTVGAPLIVMNEAYSRGIPEDPDWVEIYNASEVPVDISGYKIYDAGGQSGSKPKKEVPAGTSIAAKGFYVIVVDDAEESGFGLSSGGDEVWFENAAGNVIDNVAIPAMDVTQSYGRNPDGGPNWELLNTITKGSANSSAMPDPIILINELNSRGTETDPDWVEFYNDSPFDADISGYKIYDSGGQSGSKPKKEVPAGTTIPAKGFFWMVVDDAAESGFGLSSGGEEIWLENSAGTILDNIAFPALEEGTSYGRYPDGSDTWQILYVLTPGAANDNTIPPPQGAALMNELYSRGVETDPDWIEIFNPSTSEVDISGYKIYDSGGQSGSKPKKEFPAGTVIPAGGFYVIVTDDTEESGFGLSSGGETVWFENMAGTIIDSIAFPAMEVTQSYGRYPDGSENWQLLNTITKGAANSNVTPSYLWMNEIYSRGVETDPDWVEIYNGSAADIDISGFKIYDSGGQAGTKPKKEFPAGTVVPAMGFFVIVTDDTDESGFGLSSGGEEVWLEDAAGNIVDDIVFPAMETTQSYGRLPDGSANLTLMNTITRGATNQPK